MFLRGNIARHGLSGGEHPHATTVHVAPAKGPVRAVFGRTEGGMLLLQAPADVGEIAAWAGTLRGQRVVGMNGEAVQVGSLWAAMGRPALRTDLTEPLMRLSLADLPGIKKASLRPSTSADADLLRAWFADYGADTGLPLDAADARDRAIAPGSAVRLLEHDGIPVAMAALNATAGVDVQVGGVFVARDRRGRGFGRMVTCALLAEAREGGAQSAVLFSNNDHATRIYLSLGFRQVGHYRIAFLA